MVEHGRGTRGVTGAGVGARPVPLRFQVGARTLAAVERRLVRVPLSLDLVLDATQTGQPPVLPPLPHDAHGYGITSLPATLAPAMAGARGDMLAHVRQRYPRHHADLTIGHAAYLASLSANTRSGMRRKAKRLADVSGGTLDVRRFRNPDELAAFHPVAHALSQRTYQQRLFDGGLPDDAAFVRAMSALAAAGAVRAWLLYVGGAPAAFLYCTLEAGVVRYDHVGHDPACSALSPGGVLLMEALGDLYAEGSHRRFDFTEGDGQHKRSFATDSVDCVDLLLLRASLANRATLAALGGFNRGVAAAKQATARLGLEKLTKRLRR